MKMIKYPSPSEWEVLQQRPGEDVTALFDTVKTVLEEVRTGGDEAVRRYGERFDKVRIDRFAVTPEEIHASGERLPEELKEAIRTAHANIETFHAAQRFTTQKVDTLPGVTCRQKAVAIEKVGLYIPGGTAPLFSTVLMLAVPARIAGCGEIVLCTPPDAEGTVHPAILFAAQTAGVDQIFKVGGIQAIAAMAYGTESIPKVYKIFGPGNRYVMAAKQWVSLNEVAIDLPAGPSEVAIMADETARPAFIASDFLSQAEHGADSQSVLLTTSERLAEAVAREIERQKASLLRREPVERSLAHSRMIILKNEDEMVAFCNGYAPEHLILQVAHPERVAERIRNAGSVFIGPYTPESAGDYASGTNHTLPTGGFAKMYSGVNLDSFIRKITFQEITEDGLRRLGPVIEIMAEHERLDAHKNAVTIRLKELNKG